MMLIHQCIGKIGKYLPALFLLAGATVISAQEVKVEARLDTSQALIGDQLHLFLSVEKPVGLRVTFPGLKDTITGKIEILSDAYTDTVPVAPDRVMLGRDLLITVFDTGYFEVPSLSFLAYAGKTPDTLRTLPVQFLILPVKADTTLRDIKGNFKAPVNLAEILYYVKKNYYYGLLVIALGLLIGYFVHYFRKRRKTGHDVRREIPAELPEVIAMRELDKIRNERPWLHNRVKVYYIAVSEILRRYIEGRFHIMALEQTTGEILHALRSKDPAPSDLDTLAGILRLADLVKFAKVIPSGEENAQQVELAASFVRNTSAREEGTKQENDMQKDIVLTNMQTHA
jgi:hypothetical protein